MTPYLFNDATVIIFTVLSGFILLLEIWQDSNDSIIGRVAEFNKKPNRYRQLFYLCLFISLILELGKLWIYYK